MPNESTPSGGSTPVTSAPASSGSTQSSYSSSGSRTEAPKTYNPFQAKERAGTQEQPSHLAPNEAPKPAQPTTPQVQPQQAQPQVQQQQPQQAPQQVAPVVQMTPEILAQLMQQQSAANGQQAAQQQAQQPQVSDAEFRQRFNVFEADDNVYQAIFGAPPDSPERVAALNQTFQAIARQSVTVSRFLFEQEMGKMQTQLMQQFSPLLQAHTAQREEGYKTSFFQKHPDLADREPLLREIVESSRMRGLSFPTPEAAMEHVAATARKLLGLNGQSQQASARPQGQAVAPTMPTTSMGGRSGSGAPSAPANQAQRIFGRKGY